MLREYWLNRIALACGIAGALVLLYFSLVIGPVELGIKEIDSEMEGQRVTVQGRVDWRTETSGTLIFTLNDGAKIKVVKFNSSEDEQRNVFGGSFVKVIGRVERYRGEIEIVAEQVSASD